MKKILFVLILISISLIGVSCVSASQDTNISDVKGEAVSNFAVNKDISAGTFDELQNEIDSAKYELNLTRDYTASKGNTVK
ncbi:hypothetical protein [Methanobrevibacter sp.]|uniref:hypothetical protein n=1 Tax=Methanobrevibacter sp. TaxID=66852 RepID=UPI00388F2F0F